MGTQERRLAVLRAIVSDYVSTREPVGSKMLVERYDLGVSPATIRNDMAALEDAGFIYQPHTSAGRIPTVEGYRLFVDRLAELKPMSAPERHAIERFLSEAVDLDDVIERTVRLLAQLTRHVAVVQYPRFNAARIVRIEIVPLTSARLLVIAITSDGNVTERELTIEPVEEHLLTWVRDYLNDLACGQHLQDVPQVFTGLDQIQDPNKSKLAQSVAAAVEEALKDEEQERIVVAGTANLARFGTDFAGTIGPVLDALEEHVTLLRLFSATTGDVTVSIGDENPHQGLAETAVVSGGYGDGDARAHLAVVGPVRMDYPGAMSTVRALSAYLTHFLHERP
ncbi:MAG: heat-inducible transcriptional repressor HrcA [Actinomycetaceae bacterium]|nr:heat-inducible transcriptional repressor HrcA [Actinomycetaceae bacterium]